MANSQWSFSYLLLLFLGWYGRGGHFSIEIKQLFEPLGIVLKAASDVDALQNLVVTIMCLAQVIRHCFGVVEVGDRCREIVLTRQEDVLGASSEIFFVFVGEPRYGKRIPAKCI